MKTIAISRFRARCAAVLERIRHTGPFRDRRKVHTEQREPRTPDEIYRDLDLGPGGYANRPATESRCGAREAISKAQDDE